MADEHESTSGASGSGPSGDGAGPRGWLRLSAIAASFLIVGFVAGWIIRGDQGPTTVLAQPDGSEQAAITEQAEPTETGTTTSADPPATPEPPARGQIVVAVLNGGDVTGLAASTAEQLEELGYEDVETGNAPSQTRPTTVYFIAGQRPAAERVADDLEVGPIEQAPESGALAEAMPSGARVVVVLGSS